MAQSQLYHLYVTLLTSSMDIFEEEGLGQMSIHVYPFHRH